MLDVELQPLDIEGARSPPRQDAAHSKLLLDVTLGIGIGDALNHDEGDRIARRLANVGSPDRGVPRQAGAGAGESRCLGARDHHTGDQGSAHHTRR